MQYQFDPFHDVAGLGGEPTRERDLRSRGKQTIGRLLTAARAVLDERGYDGLRVDDVVQGAGDLSHGTFYLYFRDRDDLLESLVRLTAREVAPLTVTPPGAPTPAALSAWINRVVSGLDEHAEVLRAARALGTDLAVRDLVPPLTEWLDRLPGARSPELAAELLVWHLERAVVRDDLLDHDELAAMVVRACAAA